LGSERLRESADVIQEGVGLSAGQVLPIADATEDPGGEQTHEPAGLDIGLCIPYHPATLRELAIPLQVIFDQVSLLAIDVSFRRHGKNFTEEPGQIEPLQFLE